MTDTYSDNVSIRHEPHAPSVNGPRYTVENSLPPHWFQVLDNRSVDEVLGNVQIGRTRKLVILRGGKS